MTNYKHLNKPERTQWPSKAQYLVLQPSGYWEFAENEPQLTQDVWIHTGQSWKCGFIDPFYFTTVEWRRSLTRKPIGG